MSDNCEKSETPVIYECPQCGSDETPQRQHFGGPKDGRNKECYCKNCGLSGFIEDFRIDWHYCPLCDEKYRDAEDLGLHLVRDHDANEDTAGDSTTLDQGPCEESAAALEDVSEKSTEREFEDYFAANAPVDALSKMEKAVQLLETIDTEELRRTEQAMVSSALKSLRHSLQRWHSFRDEDTAGDDKSLLTSTNSEKISSKLEPAAWRYIHAFTEGVNVRRAELGKPPESSMKDETLEPLVRLSEHEQEVKRQRYRARIGALGEALQLIQDCDGDVDAAVRNIVNLRDGLEERLEEFTQNGGSE